jgi:hypothetical protein
VKRSTLNFQWGDRKGAWWAGYGDRHVIWADGLFDRKGAWWAGRNLGLGGPVQAPVGCSKPALAPRMGTDTMSGMPIRNVQRETFNSQLLTG